MQCQLGTGPAQILREALGLLNIRCEIRQRSTGTYEGKIDLAGSGDLGAKIFAKLGLSANVIGTASKQREIESGSVGQTPADIAWVAKVLRASEKRIVIEDFHYVSEDNRRECAFLLKALGEFGVYPIVIGVWPSDHLLSYYNGDLIGSVEDIHLTWADDELAEVLDKGTRELGIAMSSGLRRELIQDAYGNVGLLQRLAEALCRERGIFFSRRDLPLLRPGRDLENARSAVADSMRGRYVVFVDNFVHGLRRLKVGLEVYKHILRVVCEAPDDELQAGLDQKQLFYRINSPGIPRIRRSDLVQALRRLDRLQAKIDIRPVVLSYSEASKRVFVVDKSFLFFRKYGAPSWPWLEESFNPTNDLVNEEPLDLTL